MPNKYWLKTLFFLCALALFGKIDAQVRFKVALSSDSTRYQVSLYSETGPFSQSSANIISSATVTLIAPTGQLMPTMVENQIGFWSGPSTFINPVGELDRDYFVFSLNNPNDDIVFTPGLEVNLFSFANTMTCAGAVELMDNDNDPLREQDPDVNVGNQITVVNFGQVNAYSGAFQPGSANCMGAPTCDLTLNSVSKTDITSCGGDNGVIIINASNNSGTLLYSIDNGINWLNTNTFLNLGIGNYTIKVKDDICEQIYDSNPVTILEPGIMVAITDSIPVSCNTSQDGRITVVASGGLAPYEYSINNGANWTTNGTFSSLGNGVFTVKARNADSTCETAYPNLIVFSTQGINIGVDKTDVSCTTGINGTINISAAGGIGTFNYSIDNGQNWSATSDFTNLASGDYHVSVRNSNGNCETAYINNPISISESALNYTVTSTNPPCTGGALGSIGINVSGETGTFDYSINNGATWLTSATFSNLDTGSYNIIVRTTGGGCESPYVNNPVTLSISPINISVTTLAGGCENDQSNRIIVSASGGTSIFEYSKDNGANWQMANTFENLANGDYTLKVRNTDETCETAYAANPVSFTGSAINIGLNTIAPSCDVGLDGSINISAFGGNGSYIYSIDDGVTYDNISAFTGLGNGVYTIKVKNADGTCETTYANNPIQFNTPALTLVASATDAACSSATDGTIAMLGNGGTGNFEYSIDSGSTWSMESNYQDLLADVYYLQIRNVNGTCETTYPNNPIDIRPDSLVVSIVSNTPPSCVNDNDGSLILTATGGGSSRYEFSIDDGMTWQAISTFQNLPSGAYAIKAKIANTDCITTYPNNPVLVENTNCPDLSTVDTCLLAYVLAEANGIYTISLKTDTTWTGNQTTVSNAQVAIRVPTGGFQIGNVTNKLNGANFAVTGESINPSSAAGYDYYAFTLHAITTAIPFTKGNTVDLFSFENVGNCIGGSMNLIGRGAIANPGIENLNFDAQITVSGWGDPDAPVCSANSEVPICDPAPECIVNLVLDKVDSLFIVGMIPDTTWAAPLNTMNSAQITLRIPSKGYTIDNFKNAIDGVVFNLTSRQNSPIIEAGYDYLSITLGSFGTTGIPFNKGVKTDLFSFEINGACTADSIYLVGEGSAFDFPNGEGENTTSQMTVLGWNMADVPVCVQTTASPLCTLGIDLVVESNASYCGASDGTISIGSSCSGAQTQYSIDNGITYQATSEFNHLLAGDYFIKIRNQVTNCELSYAENPITITDGQPISFTASPINPICTDSTNGAITLTANNGSGMYQYSLDDGATWSLSPNFTSLGNGIYTPKVSNLDTTCITAYDTISLTLLGISCTQDSDGDGQADIAEDLNMDGNLENDDTDMDGIPNYQDADDDGDGISTAMEEAGPNQGDSNGDGNPDCLQENVATTQDEQGNFRTLEVNNLACQKISEFVIYPEGRMSEDDPNYDFPFQLNAFTIPCGGTVTINLYFHNVADLAEFEYRKFGPTIPGGAISDWYDFPVTITQVTIGGIVIGKVTFQLTDGGTGDATGVDNMIIDPGGIAMNVNNGSGCSINYGLEKIGETYMVSLTSDTSLVIGENEVDSAMITLRAPTGILDVTNFTNDDTNVLFALDSIYVAPVETPNYDYFVFKLSAASIGTNNISILEALKEPLFTFENGGACSFDSLLLVGENTTFTTPLIGGQDIASAITLSGWNAPTCVTSTGALFCIPMPTDTVEVAMFAGLATTICLTNEIQLPNNIGNTSTLFQGAAVTGVTSVMDSCVQLNAQASFAGRDFITVVFCDAVNATICDTTVLDITVSPQPICLINFFIEDSMGTFQCKMVSDTTWDEPLNEVISAQFTIRTPTGSFEMANLQNGLGMVDFDLQTTTTQGGYDYLNIVLQTLNTQDVPFQKGDTVCLFSFENSRYCTVDSLFLIGEGSPVAAPEVGDEPIFSKLAIQGWGGGTQSVPACVMNYGLPICPITTPTTDTIHLVMEENDTVSVCVDSVLELLNRVGVVNVCINGTAIDIAVNDNDSCVTLQAPLNFVGNDTICVMHFDIAELGYRDTTIFVITVNEKPYAPTDTLNFTINDTTEICLGTALQLNNIGAATILSTGNQVNVIVTDNDDCLTLQPTIGFVGNDTLQVIHCDANNPTFCDTTMIVVTVEGPAVCLFEYLIDVTDDVYTVKLVVGADVVSNLSATLSMLTAIRVPITGFNVPTDSITTLLAGTAFENTSNGVLVDEEEPNYGYILFDIVGNVTPNYQQGDTLDLFSFRGTSCLENAIELVGPGATFPNPTVNTEEITSFLSIGAYLPTGGTPYCVNPVGATANCNIMVTPDPAPRDTLHYVLDFETPRIVCIDSALQLLNTVGNVTICEQGTNVTVNVINGDSCVALTPEANFTGNDTLCVIHCDAVMTDFCDTTILIITVNPNEVTPPTTVDSSCAISFELTLTNGVYVVSMISDTTLANTTFPTPIFPNPFIPAPTNLMDITVKAPTGQLQIVNQVDFGTGREFVLKSSIISPAEDPTQDYFVFGLNANNTPTINIPYVKGASLDLFSFQNISCSLDSISLVGRGTDFGALIINGSNINTNVIANSDTIPACVNRVNITPPMLAFSTTNTAPTTGVCNDGTITITATGGTGLYEYSINNGTDWFSNNEFTALEVGTYLVRVRSTDEVCLSDAATVTLQNTDCAPACDIIITSIDSTNATCSIANGILTINATGSNLQYSINTGATFQSNNTFENIAAGTYNVVVRDSVTTSCEANITITLNGTTLPEIQSVELAETNAFAANLGTITIFATGASDLRYSIDGGLNFFEGNAFNNLGFGSYTVVVANGDESCPVMYSNNPIQIDEPCTVDAGEDRMICLGAAVALSTSGTAPIFGWTPSTGLSCTDCPNPIANPDTTTTYIVTNSGGGCFVMDTIIITVLPTITADFNFMTSCTDLSVQFTDTSRTTGTITSYAWDFGDGGVATVANPSYTYTTAGSYTVQLTTTIAGDCTNTVSKLVVVGDGLMGTVSDDASICAGDCTQLMAAGGTTYTWMPAEGLNETNVANPMACPTATTTYYVTIANGTGCSTMDSVTVTITSPTIGVSAAGSTCGDNNGVITIFASLPEETLEFQLFDNDEWFTTNSFTSLTAGEYNVRVRTTNGVCVTAFPNNPVVIGDTPGAVIDSVTANSPTDCNMANGNITINASGANPLIYSIDDGANWSVSNSFTGLGQGNYAVQVAYADTTCLTPIQTIQLNPPVAPIILEVTSTNPTTCTNNNGTINVEVDAVAAGNNLLEYSLDGINWQSNNLIDTLSAGTYSVFVRYENQNCITEYATTITLNPASPPVIAAVAGTAPSAIDNNDGTIEITATGSATIEYSIDSGIVWQTSNVFNNLDTGSYSIIVRYVDGSCPVVYNQPLVLNVDICLTITDVTRMNPEGCGINTGVIAISATGTNDLQYSIDSGRTWQANNNFTDLAIGTYYLFARHIDSTCLTPLDSTIVLNANGQIDILEVIATSPMGCADNNGSIEIIADGGINLEYSIDNGATWQADSIFNNLTTSAYTIVVRTADEACQTTYNEPVFLIGDFALEITDVTSINPVGCGAINGAITITAAGSDTLEYSIDNGGTWQSDSSFNNLAAGIYTIVVRTPDNVCQAIHNAPVILMGSGDIMITEVTSTNPTNCSGTNGVITITAAGATNLEYSIDNGSGWQIGNVFNNLPAGTYVIMVRTADSLCQVAYNSPVVLIENGGLIITDVSSTNPTDCGGTNGVITITATGANNLEYSIDNGGSWHTSNVFNNLPDGTYTIMARTVDLLCQVAYTSPVTLIGSGGLVITDVSSTNPTDCGGTNGVITITATGANNLEYSIDNGGSWQVGNVFNNLPAGTYTIMVRTVDLLCQVAYNNPVTLIGSGDLVIIDVSTTNPAECGANNGTIVINATGANILQYSINNGTTWAFSNTFTNLTSGTYGVLIRTPDSLCQVAYTNPVILMGSGDVIITDVASTNPTDCGGTNGVITITASGLTDLEYSIDNGGSWHVSNVFNNLPDGTYAIMVRTTDLLCQVGYSSPVILIGSGGLVINDVNSTNPTDCEGTNGIITITATGANNLEYSIDNGGNWQASNVFNNLSDGTYTIMVRTTDLLCQIGYTSPVTLIGSGGLVITDVNSTNPTDCEGTNGIITITATGANNLEYSIDNGGNWQASNIFNNLSDGSYTIMVRTADLLCQVGYTSPVILIGNGGLLITDVSSTNPTDCGGTNGIITITASGANNLEYSIDNGGSWQASNVFNNLPAGAYTIMVRTGDLLCQAAYTSPVILMGSGDLLITDVSSTNPTDCGGTNGIITITASGANNLEYSIDNGGSWHASNVFTNLPAGAYTIMVRTADILCQAIYPTPVVLMDSGDLNIIEVTTTNSGDCGANNGTIIINATGANILQYSINNGATWEFSNTFTNLAPGIYTVLIQTPDARCQIAHNTIVEITGSQAITILDVFSGQPTEVGNDGIIEVFAAGNNSLAYSIDNGVNWQPSNLFNGLNAGTYTVLVRYTDGTCIVSYPIEIILSAERCLLFIDVLAHSPQGCGTNDGHILILSNIVGDYVEYSINNGLNWQNSEAFENLNSGEYTILARRTDINCQIALDSTITLEEGEDLMILHVDAIDRDVCNNFGGEILINTNIFNNIEYSIDNGNTWQFDPFFSNVAIGRYTILARSVDLTCQTTYNEPVQINAVQNVDISTVVANNPTNCNSANGSIFIEANVGFNAEFSIDNGLTWQPNNDFNNLAAGTYNIKVRTGNCEIDYVSNPVILGSPNAFSVVTPIPNRAICTDALMSVSVTLSDLIDSYQVKNGTIANPVLNGTTLIFDAIVTDLFNEYEITFTNAIGCEVTESFTIFQATDTEADFVVIEPYCREMEVSLLFTGTATPMADLIWELDGGVLISSSPATATEPAGKEIVVRWNEEGSRLIKLTVNDGGCIDDEYESIFVRKLPLVDAGENTSICMGECVELAGSGTGVWYTWSPAAGLSSTNGQNVTACPTETTTYTLTVMSADGCISVDSVTVNVETGFVIMTQDVTICEGESTALRASGGTNYTWFPAATLDNPNTATPIATPAVTTLYEVASANENGCIDTAYVTVFVNPKPEAIACEDKTICRGESIQLIVTTHAQYSWSPTNTLVNPNSGTPIASPTETTTYTVTVTDENGCTDTDEVIVFVNTPPTVNAGNDVTICTNAATSLSASGAVNYSWSPAQGLSNPNIANPIANPSVTTTYTVTGTDFNGCTSIDQVTVAVIESTGISAGNDVTICDGNIVQLNAVGGSNYVWSPTTGLNNPNIANPIAIPTVTTTYTVTGISQNGCSSVDEVVIFVNPRPEAVACEDKTICSGESIQLTVTTHAQYSWSPTNTLLNPTSGTPIAFPTETTTYTVTVTDENGCTDIDEVVVFVNTPTIVNLGPDVTLCGAGTVALDAGEGIAYQWSPTTGLSNPNSRNPIATVTNTTTYTVQVTNADGCIGTDNVTININNGPNADAGPPVVLCPGGTGQLMASGGVTYQWSPAAGLSNPNIANPIVTATQVTNYQVTVTDEFGCTATDETLVTVSLPLAVDPIINNANCCGTGGNAILNVSGGFGNATFSWSPNVSTSNTATNLAAGFYKVVITDAVGCSIIFTFEIKEDCDGCPDMFSEDEICITDTDTTERICVPIALEDIGGYEILVGGNNYVPDHGCAHESLTAYSYALVEGQGNTGMYEVENWEVNGQMFSTEVETMQELTFWMNTVDPSGNWIIHPSILTIIGGDPDKTYGTMKVIQLTKWIETMLQPDVTGVATSSIIEVDVRTMNEPIEVIIVDTATCCSDTLLIKRCGEAQPCVVEIIPQNQFQEMIDCGASANICLDIPFSNINNYDLVANNSPFTGEILPCNYDSMFAYTYFTLPGQGLAGPYKVTNWIVDGQMHAGMFNTLPEFAQLMNQIDPTGNWKLEETSLTIQGGNSMTNYGAINIEQISTGAVATLEINSNLIPMGTQLTFTSGNYEVLINDINSGCRDRFLVNVSCNDINPIDTTITPVDTTITPVDTTITPVDTTITPVDTTITPVDTTITPVDTTITPVDTTITPVDTTITPVDTTITPVDTTITPVDTTITPIDTTITPIDTTITPVDTTITPVDTTITPVDTTITPIDTTITPVDTTITPVDTTITPIDTTITPVDTTITPVDTTITPVDTTITPDLCVDFITEEVLFAMINRCDSLATFCIDIPFAEINDYTITVDGQVYQDGLMDCTGGTAIQVGVGGFSFLFEHLTTGCKDSIILAVTCATSPREEVITLEEGDTEIYCPASDELIGDIITIHNACPEEAGVLTMLTLDTIDYCVNVTGLLVGEEKACLVLCDANGICDTTYLIIRVTPKPLLNPIAERDTDTTEESTIITIDVLANDSVFGTLQNMEILTQPENGTATFNLDNTITYVPNDNFCDSGQPDLIMYGICNDNGCDTAMVEIWVPCGDLDIKNGFSPNNDGVNDYFRISGVQNFPDNSVKIFNRWGLEVFSQKGYKNRWDGTFKDKNLPDGTYFYIFDDGKGKNYSGWVQINR